MIQAACQMSASVAIACPFLAAHHATKDDAKEQHFVGGPQAAAGRSRRHAASAAADCAFGSSAPRFPTSRKPWADPPLQVKLPRTICRDESEVTHHARSILYRAGGGP